MSYDPTVGRWITEDPIGFEGNDANLYRYVGNSPTNYLDPSGLYEQDIHYYMTYYLAVAAGIPASDAAEIAWATNATDYHPDVEPVQFFKPGGPYGKVATSIRRKYHFRTSGDKVKGGSDEAAQIVNDAIKGKNKNNILMGIGLHAYQDSWSHEGYGPEKGHGIGKDNPDYPYNDPKKAMKMAEETYKKLVEYRQKHFPGSKSQKSFDDIKKPLETLMRRDGNERERAARWKDQIKNDFKLDTSYDPLAIKKRAKEFGDIAKNVAEPK
jgi:uncharacterized protein RhaS with RHS repeats